ncbi:hypothetical protein Tco_1470870 [Tanacetum coccineum]
MWNASRVYKEGNIHLHAGREGVSIVKGNSYIDVGRKALGGRYSCRLKDQEDEVFGRILSENKGEYDMWRLRIEQYFQVQDYALWDVIENGNSFKPAAQTTTNVDGTSTLLIPGPVTTEEKYKDAKNLFAAIQTRFGGNEATKKTQKTLLKQMYENFSAPSTESLFLRSLPSEWNTHVVAWRNKPDLDTMSFDDLYNNFKIVEQ